MDFQLLISAQTLVLAPQLQVTPPADGLRVVKNVPAKTYLRLSEPQWEVLQLFETSQLVPAVLDLAIRTRRCLPLGEFFELVLKAERAGILIRPGQEIARVEACEWRGAIRPEPLLRPLGVLLLSGLVLSLGFRPELPASWVDLAMGALIILIAANLAEYVRGAFIRGAGGEVYHPGFRVWPLPPGFKIDASDAILLPRKVQDALVIVRPAFLAAAAGITIWNLPAWSFLPLVALMWNLRPLLGGQFPTVVRLGQEAAHSDTEHAFLFPPNRSPRARWRMLVRAVREKNTWVRLCYAIVWTLMVVYLAARLTDLPPWNVAFWDTHGLRVGTAVVLSLATLGLGYALAETLLFIRHRGRIWLHQFRLWRQRWWHGRAPEDEAGRLHALTISTLLRALDASQRQALARALAVTRFGPWRRLADFEGEEATRVGLVLRGRIVARRDLGRKQRRPRERLGPGDLIGLHAVADPGGGRYRLRCTTPVTLLSLDRVAAQALLLDPLPRGGFTNLVVKVPFLRSTTLCRHWHAQAVERFAQLSTISSYPPDGVIVSEGQLIDRFFIIFEGEAAVSREGTDLAVLRVGQYFGEIGLLQNSNAVATITARGPVRCLAIARNEFLRFVTHNFAVALELERISSARLGRPIFPVHQSDFRAS